MLDDRKTAILSAVVQEYISTAQPVGSNLHRRGSVASRCRRRRCATRWRSSNRRATSSSRTRPPGASRPTRATGTSSITSHRPGRLDRATTKQVGEFFSAAHGRLEEMLHQTSNLLASMTNNAAVVRRPARRGDRRPARPTRVVVADAGDRRRRARQRNGGEHHDRPARGRRRGPVVGGERPPLGSHGRIGRSAR